jgi:hypothetical protein
VRERFGQAIQHYSCFISYSSKDDEFVRRLHADLQDKGVRCWFAPEDLKIGAKILDTLDQAIRLRDKVLLVLSEASIGSESVEDEVTKAFEEERQRGGVVLFPVRLDDAVFATKEAWAGKLRANRHIGDFRNWKNHNTQKALERCCATCGLKPRLTPVLGRAPRALERDLSAVSWFLETTSGGGHPSRPDWGPIFKEIGLRPSNPRRWRGEAQQQRGL